MMSRTDSNSQCRYENSCLDPIKKMDRDGSHPLDTYKKMNTSLKNLSSDENVYFRLSIIS